ncbi:MULTISPECIES: BBE domain-containing protein [unclassified Streptomyces]
MSSEKDNYPRLQRVKSRWDPLNVFHHPLAVRPAGS